MFCIVMVVVVGTVKAPENSKIHIKLHQEFIPLSVNTTNLTDQESIHNFSDNINSHLTTRPIPITNLLRGEIEVDG